MKLSLVRMVVIGSLAIIFSQCGDKSTNINSGPDRVVLNYAEPTWGPSGIILFNHSPENGGPSGLWSINSDGTDKRFILDGSYIAQDWSPDGQWIAVVKNAQIFKVRLDGTELTQLTFGSLRKFFPAWRPDGNSIVYSIQDGPFDGWGIWAVSAAGESERHIVYQRETNVATNPDWSPNNQIVFVGYTEGISTSKLMIMNDAGANLRVIFDPNRYGFDGGVNEPAFSPDGHKVVFQTNSSGERETQIWVVDVDGKHPVQLTTAGGVQPSWSPDGQHIVYVRLSFRNLQQKGNGKLWVMDIDGSNKTQLTF